MSNPQSKEKHLTPAMSKLREMSARDILGTLNGREAKALLSHIEGLDNQLENIRLHIQADCL